MMILDSGLLFGPPCTTVTEYTHSENTTTALLYYNIANIY